MTLQQQKYATTKTIIKETIKMLIITIMILIRMIMINKSNL